MFQLTANTQHVPTMTSIEMVEFINASRTAGEPELRHNNFMAKVPKVLGEGLAAKFLATNTYVSGKGGERVHDIYRFPKREACLMAMSYSYELQAKVFDRMTALETRQVSKSRVEQAQIDMMLVTEARAALELSKPAALLALQTFARHHNVPTDLLPSYAIVTTPGADVQSSKPAHALTHHLEQHNLNITPIAVNKLLEAAGYLETKARIGSKGQEKRYKSVTQKGLRYGYNMTSPQQQRQTQPYWFDDTFTELMADVGVYPA